MKSSSSLLFSKYQLNHQLTLKNRIVMAPMTRCQATSDFVPTEQFIDYYARRSQAGLIVTEGTIISLGARGYDNVPGIFNSQQVQAWQKVTKQVHTNNGLIFSQLWHVGRVSHPYFLNGELPVGPSATVLNGPVKRAKNLQHGQCRALTLLEMEQLITDYQAAAVNAIKAGFDGVELHGANGYLIDQFLHCCTNLREDEYGGTPENMARFALDIIKACGEAIGFERVAIRLSPGGYLNEIFGEPKDAQVFKYLLQQLNHLPIAYVHTGNFNDTKRFAELNDLTMTQFLRKFYMGNLIACGGYDCSSAQESIENNHCDLIAFGRPFIANYDLVQKLCDNQALEQYNEKMLESLV